MENFNMGYIEHKKGTKAQTYYSGKNPRQQSLAERISFGTGNKNKQSPGFVDMIVNTIKKALD
jgi:hypothetical protein